MSELTIKTNNTPRLIMSWHDLTAIEQAELDYIDPNDGGGSFFRYKNQAYDLNEFTRINDSYMGGDLEGWDGLQGQSYFSGILIKFSEDGDGVIVGRYYC